MRIEELARRSGFSVRALRELQARGLLAPPELRGRVGYYSDAHLARAALVRRLRDRGYSLAGVARLLERVGQASEQTLEEIEVGVASAVVEQRPMRGAEVDSILDGMGVDEGRRARMTALEIVVDDGGERLAPSGELLIMLRELVEAGYPLDVVLDEIVLLREDADRIASRFRAMTEKYIVRPFLAAGAPPERAAEFAERLPRVRPIGTRILAILMSQNIERGGR